LAGHSLFVLHKRRIYKAFHLTILTGGDRTRAMLL